MAYSASSFQLTHLFQRTFRKLKVARSSLATGGSTTTIVDTRLPTLLGDSNEDDYLNEWSVIVTRDAGGAGASPEGKYNRVSDYDDGGTITVPDTLTDAPAAGDRYMFVSPDFPLYDMLEVFNDALVSLDVGAIDTSITTAANQTEYTLPLGLKHADLLNVEIQGITTDANDNRWIPVPNWDKVPAAGGSTGTIILPQFASGYTVRLTYIGLHPRVNVYDDYINESIHPNLAVAVCAAYALEWYNTQRGGTDEFWLKKEDIAKRELDIAKQMFPIILPQRRFPNFPGFGYDTPKDEFYPIPLP